MLLPAPLSDVVAVTFEQSTFTGFGVGVAPSVNVMAQSLVRDVGTEVESAVHDVIVFAPESTARQCVHAPNNQQPSSTDKKK
jgi:hypothetical protein